LNNKKLTIPFLASIFLIPSVLAQNANMLAPLTDAIKMFANFIFFDMKNTMGANNFARVLIGIVLFTVFYSVLTNMPWQNNVFKKKNIAMPISAVMALISTVAMPDQMIFAIVNSYGFTTSFLLMAVPVVAVIYIAYKAFPTGPDKDVGTRRVNHGIKAVIFYFVATLIQNYMLTLNEALALTGEVNPPVTFPADWQSMSSLVVAAAMFLFLYHIIMAIFSSAPAAEGESGAPGLLERITGGGPPGEGIPRPGEEGSRGERDFGPIEGRIGSVEEILNDYDQETVAFLRGAEAVRRAPDAEREDSEVVRGFYNAAAALSVMGQRVNSAARAVADYAELFRNLPERDIARLSSIVRRIRECHERVIDAIIAAQSGE